MRGVSDTINAAASAIQSAENRPSQESSSVQKRRWGNCWNISLCFGSQKQSKRIGDSVIVPEPGFSRTVTQPPTTVSQPPAIVLPFIAPPSSPASFFQSEPPSATHSPGGVLSFTSVSGATYSPDGPRNMFAIGPYAHETQLVSPPVFSTYTTEPSTAPFTPPPESVHLTTPSSPEVPYARYFGSGNRNNGILYEFQSYQLYPGSPMGCLKSPGSGISNSGTSSPFMNGDFNYGGTRFPISGKVSPCQWDSRTGSGALTPNPVDLKSRDEYLVTSFKPSRNEGQQHLVDHRVSFEVTPEQVVRCVERRRCADVASGRERFDDDMANDLDCSTGEGVARHQKHRSTSTLGSVKEFNFDSTDGHGPGSDGPIKNWSFFPMIQPGVS